MSTDIAKESAADMLAAARRLYEMIDGGPDFPGRERFLRDARNRISLLEKRAKEELE